MPWGHAGLFITLRSVGRTEGLARFPRTIWRSPLHVVKPQVFSTPTNRPEQTGGLSERPVTIGLVR